MDVEEKKTTNTTLSDLDNNQGKYGIGETHFIPPSSQDLQRKLRSKEVQLFAIGGAIGTCMSIHLHMYDIVEADIHPPATFMQMAAVLPSGGPAGLFLGFIIWGSFMVAVNECFGMICLSTVSVCRLILRKRKWCASFRRHSRLCDSVAFGLTMR
jgi:amino acid permease